ncbi:hypothetical protein PGTUg99_031067 [Puccinia graminis f. sp. tritici]|uniref:Uncharacterized protein n=1 Tax=Puccinia graminis f. sp. tritici TaxID=56615 RepID=A0A5B0MRN5_PUCGR|nr:hypothetical protein PGTUg99_010229 [Puccinia graminis f. sp. tritici]KAA1115993.1 hypothetical protein PGTUg99_031067 [Puccinia graminis f. sp. tritici]
MSSLASAISHPLTPSNQNTAAPRPPPLNDLATQPPRKRKRALQPDDSTNPLPQPFEEMMKKSVLELSKEAQENSKGAMSEDDRQFFLEYYTEQRQMLIIKAIERGVSMPMVDGFLGKRIALKEPSGWNNFMKTEEVRELFRDSKYPPLIFSVTSSLNHLLTAGTGVNDGEAMKKASEMWNRLTDVEKKAYASVTSQLTEEDEVLDEASGAQKPPATREIPHLRSTVSFRKASEEVEHHMDAWLEQFMRSTPGATPFLQFSLDKDQTKHYPARFQSYITGHSEVELAAMAKNKKNKRRVKNGMTVTDRMNNLIDEKTSSIFQNWLWTNTDARLADRGYKVVLAPNATIDIEWIKTPSRFLSGQDIQMLHLDLDNQLIDLVRIPRVPLPKRQKKITSRRSSPGDDARSSGAMNDGTNQDNYGVGRDGPTCTSNS